MKYLFYLPWARPVKARIVKMKILANMLTGQKITTEWKQYF